MNTKKEVVVVTGGTRGIGLGIVKRLHEEGYFVYFSYCNSKEKADQIAEELEDARTFLWNGIDIEGLEAVVDEIKKNGQVISALVNNSGITRDGYFAMMNSADMDSVIDINLKGTMKASRAVVRTLMGQKRGAIINITSIAGILGTAGQTNYSASKAGLIGFTRSLSRELGRYNVRVVGVAPGFIETEMYAKIPISKRREMISGVPLNRPGTVEEIANIVEFLISDKATYINGTTLVADGGLT